MNTSNKQFYIPALVVLSVTLMISSIVSYKKINDLEYQVANLNNGVHGAALTVSKSQDDVITEAVAKITPSVVSVIISKDMPNLEITYDNPFGDNSYFKSFKIPFFHQNGTTKKQVGAGSGFVVSKDGYILTNKHVVEDDNAYYTVLLADGTQKPAKVVYKDPSKDIAVIKIEGNYTPVVLGDSSTIKLGQTVVAVGNALGEYNNSVSIGVISGLNRTIKAVDERGGDEDLSGVIQTDAAINQGNSGGPLVDKQGNVIGVNVATVVGSNNISFAIPINDVRSMLTNMFSI